MLTAQLFVLDIIGGGRLYIYEQARDRGLLFFCVYINKISIANFN